MISVRQLYWNRLEDVANLSNTIEFQEFHGKSEKLEKKKVYITTKKKVTKKDV